MSDRTLVAAKDAETRRQEVMRLELRESLSERGAVVERVKRRADDRPMPIMHEMPKLVRSDDYLEYVRTRKKDNKPSYLQDNYVAKPKEKKKQRR